MLGGRFWGLFFCIWSTFFCKSLVVVYKYEKMTEILLKIKDQNEDDMFCFKPELTCVDFPTILRVIS